MSVATRLSRLEKKAVEAGWHECRHCFWGLVRIDREYPVSGWLGYESVVIRERIDFDAHRRFRDPLSDADKARVVGWRDDDTWNPADLRCRWCGQKVSCVRELALPSFVDPGGSA